MTKIRQEQLWVHEWHTFVQQAQDRGESAHLTIGKPLEPARLTTFEQKHAIRVPQEFRDTLTLFSSTVGLFWELPTTPFRTCNSPVRLWDFEMIETTYAANADIAAEYKETMREIIEAEPENFQSDPDYLEALYHYQIWGENFPITDFDGDTVAINLTPGILYGSVYYIEHVNDERYHGRRLAPSFGDFMSRWSAVGCAGSHFSEFELFYDTERSELLEPDHPRIQQLRAAAEITVVTTPSRAD